MRVREAFEAAQQLGWDQAIQNALYRTALRLGWYKTRSHKLKTKYPLNFHDLFTPVEKEEILTLIGANGLNKLISQADEIVSGNFERFGSGRSAINLTPQDANYHWSDIERGIIERDPLVDIKEIWEPARFAWAITLGKAFALTNGQNYPDAFLSYLHFFIENNPIDHGSNWISGQEVGIRLINTLIAARLFEPVLTERSKHFIAGFTVAHAERVRETLVYARSQNNNHYLVECIALLTASIAVPGHVNARTWYRLGRKGIIWCLQNQIHSTGEYVQHSTNYHRLMLQAMVWAVTIEPALLDDPAIGKMLPAIDWFAARVDKISGSTPNLGANDGALLFPLDGLRFTDHRGVLQQSLRAFTMVGSKPGLWDEGAMWFGLPRSEGIADTPRPPSILHADRAWAELRVIEHTDRPSHADHLHLDLWWKGSNICLDPGTYSYNLPAPWDNSFMSASAHNTVTVNNFDQMRRVSKFLYLDWGNSWIENADPGSIRAVTDVWERLGISHKREVALVNNAEWKITDHLTSVMPQNGDHATLRWNFPEAPWTIFETEGTIELTLRTEVGKIAIFLSADGPINGIKLVRGGSLVHGVLMANETEGWHSRGYLKKDPCLSFIMRAELARELNLSTTIRLDEV